MFEQYVDNLSEMDEIFPQGKVFRIVFDNTVAKFRILARDYYDLEKIIMSFSVSNESAFFSKQYGFKAEDRLYSVNKFGFFSIGLIFEIFDYIKSQYGTLDVIAMSQNAKQFLITFLMPLKDFIKRHDRDSFEVNNISSKLQMRDYQINAIKALLFDGYGRGLIELPTGSGKSFFIANFIYTLWKQYDSSLKTLIYVPNRQLVDQFYTDLLDYGFSKEDLTKLTAGLKKDEKYDPDAKIIIANRQYLFKNKEKLPRIDVLVCDEAHQCADYKSVTYQFIEQLNAKIKIGCSGTLPRDKFKKWSLIGLFSKILYTENIVALQSQGYLANVKLTVFNINDTAVSSNRNISFNLDSFQKYVEGGDIAFNQSYSDELEYMNKNCMNLYEKVLDYLKDQQGNTLVLFDRIEFGKALHESISRKCEGKTVYYIDGSVKPEYREEVRKNVELNDNIIIVAQTATTSTGVNFKNLRRIMFSFQTKSTTQIVQSIGRSLRLHKDKDFSEIVDVVFQFKYSKKHFDERKRIYREFYNIKKADKVINIEI